MRNGNTWWGVWARLGAVLAIFAIANVATYFGSAYFEKESNYRATVEGLRDHPRAHVLFAGDSHTAHPLNAYLSEHPDSPAYSVGFGGDSPREMFAKFRQALRIAPQIDTLVIPAEPHMFGGGRVNSSNRSFADWYFIAARDRSGLRTTWPSALLDQVPLLNDDFLQYLRKLITARSTRHKPAAADADAVGSAWESFPEATRAAKAKETGEMDHQGIGEHPEPYAWYSRILELARERGVRVVGVRYPVHHEYAASVDAATTAKLDRFLLDQGMAQIIDLSGAFENAALFDDADHVKPSQAEALLHALSRKSGIELVTPE